MPESIRTAVEGKPFQPPFRLLSLKHILNAVDSAFSDTNIVRRIQVCGRLFALFPVNDVLLTGSPLNVLS